MRKLLLSLLLVTVFSTTLLGATLDIRKLGGLVTKTNEYEMSESNSPDMSNFTLDTAGSLSERNLFKKYNATTIGNTSLNNIYKFYLSSDSSYLITTTGKNIYKATSGVLTDISITGNTALGSQWSFESFTDGVVERVFAVNQDSTLCTWTGTDTNFRAELGGPATNCNIIKKHKSRLWASGSKAYPYRICYSSLNNGLDWTTSGGSFDLPVYEKIMALEVLGDVLYVFTRSGIYAILGDTPNEFYITKTISKVGTHAKLSVASGGNLIFFLNKAGVFIFDGNDSTNISEPIQPTIDAISNTYISYSAGVFDNRGRYWLSYTSTNGSFNDKILVYDTVLKQWYMLDGANLSCFYKADGGNDKGEMFAGCSDLIGYLWQLQLSSSLEQITHSTEAQLLTGVTFNTVITSDPMVKLGNGGIIDYNEKLLVHFNGVDEAATYTTDDFYHRVVTFNADAQLDTTQKKFGTASLLTDGVNDNATVPDSDDWDLGSENFTIDLWVRFNTAINSRSLIEHIGAIGTNGWILRVRLLEADELQFTSWAGAEEVSVVTTDADLTTGTWYHIAVSRNGSDFRIFLNGANMGTSTYAGALSPGTTTLGISGGVFGSPIDGWIDEVRLVKGITKYWGNFTPLSLEHSPYVSDGTLTSQPLQINASGQANLGTISWQEVLPTTGTDIQFTVRTGATSDTVFFNSWQTWVSSSTVVDDITDNTITCWISDDPTYTVSGPPYAPQDRNIILYETDDSVSPNAVMMTTKLNDVITNFGSMGDSIAKTFPTVDLRNYKWVGYWLKAYTTGNSVELYLTTSGNTIGLTTANTVSGNTWEYHYFPLSAYSSSDLQYVNGVKLRYCDNSNSTVYLGRIHAYDFLDNLEPITSTPNDFIQYRAILGSAVLGNDDLTSTPRLINANSYVITLSYTATTGDSETSLESYWKSKKIDAGNNKNKLWQFVEFDLKSENPTTNHTVYLDYWLNDVQKTRLTGYVPVTNSTTKVRFYLPSGSYGKVFQWKIYDNDIDDNLKFNNATISYIQEGGS